MKRVVGILAVGLASVAVAPVGAASDDHDDFRSDGVAAAAFAERGMMTRLSDPAFPGPYEWRFGTSVQGRPLVAFNRRGSLDVSRTVVAISVIHGDERHGRLVTDELMTVPLPADLDLWIVPTVNPDGEALGNRWNARSVDLNRNWPANWESGTFYSSGRYHSGSGPGSEPETRSTMEFLRSVRPEVTIWFHSPWNRVDCNEWRVGQTCLDYAAAVGSYSAFAPRPGTATDWVMTDGLGVSFIHEFASYAPSPSSVQRHVRAVLDLSR